jgi:DNA replication and repair protein RecF
MYIHHLALNNYRNYKKIEVEFEHKVNLILGENAQGKTNLIESIYVLAFSKSHRTSREKELISWDSDFAKITGQLHKKSGPFSMDIIISSQGKKAKINGLEQRKLSDYIGVANVVMFAPEDLNLVKGAPQIRRRFIDMEIGQINPLYLHHLSKYQKILLQRNHLLKELQRKKGNEMMLDVLTEQLVESGAKLLKKRYEFLEMLQIWAENIHFEISRGQEKLNLQYKPSIDVSEKLDLSKIEKEFHLQFSKIREKEIQRGTTLIGPHRDDVSFLINNRDVQTFGSQGQQRTTALSVKLAEIELIKEKIGEYPILLLDDVLSELDDYRQTHLLNTIKGKVQTFVTTTNIDGIDHQTLREAATYTVLQGEIKKLK